MRAIIIGGGDVGDYIIDYVQENDYIICADSGFDSAVKYGLLPNVVIGDMDSVKGDYSEENVIIYPSRKDYTDSDLAIMYALDNGYTDVLLFGMTGTRMDHSFANLSLLLKCKDINAVIINSNNIIRMVFDKIVIEGEIGDTVSILPFSGNLMGVTTKGLEYPLDNDSIKIGTSLGVSNKMSEKRCEITVKEGIALVIRSKD